MTFRFAKYGFINALWSLIPIFPIWTLFPGVLCALGLEKLINDCEASYRVVLWVSVFLTITLTAIYTYRLEKIILRKEKDLKRNFRFWSLILYTLTNTVGMIIIVGVNSACQGDGQTLLACIYSGPIASLTLIIFGLILDINTTVANNCINKSGAGRGFRMFYRSK